MNAYTKSETQENENRNQQKQRLDIKSCLLGHCADFILKGGDFIDANDYDEKESTCNNLPHPSTPPCKKRVNGIDTRVEGEGVEEEYHCSEINDDKEDKNIQKGASPLSTLLSEQPPPAPSKGGTSSFPCTDPRKINTTIKNKKKVEMKAKEEENENDSNYSCKDEINNSQQRQHQRHNQLHRIDVMELRRISSRGISEACQLRPLAWRVLLGFVPSDIGSWDSVLKRERGLYSSLIGELFETSRESSDNERGVEGTNPIYQQPLDDTNVDIGNKNDGIKEREGRSRLNTSSNSSTSSSSSKSTVVAPEKMLATSVVVCGLDPKHINTLRILPPAPLSFSRGQQQGHIFSACPSTATKNAPTSAMTASSSTSSLSSSTSLPPSSDLPSEVLLDEIRKDVVRTHPDLQFFLEAEGGLGLRRYAALERILFVWAKLNKGVRYVQGMNEIVGTMYFVLANDSNKEWAKHAEADTYFLFNTIMVEMRDIYVAALDDADTGIQGRMANMISLLSVHDPEVRCHLDDCGIDPSFYSIRWLTTLLSREFLLPDTIRLWDSMFASTHKENFMRYACVTMVMVIREELLRGDFGSCLRLLQSYPPTSVDQLLESSRALWIYESQVTLACHKGGISLSQALATIAPPPAVVMAYGLPGGVIQDRKSQKLVDRGLSMVSAAGTMSAVAAAVGVGGGDGGCSSGTIAAAGRSIKGFFGFDSRGSGSGSSGDRGKKSRIKSRRGT